MSKIFISYKRVDKDRVFAIKDEIENALNVPCWIDLDGIESDSQFINVIIKAINECEIFLFMYSKAHGEIVNFEKDWTMRELNFAMSKGKRIIFVNIDGTPLTDQFAFMFGTQQQVDASSTYARTKLIKDLKKRMGITILAKEEDKEQAPSSIINPKDHRIDTKGDDGFRLAKNVFEALAFIFTGITVLASALSLTNEETDNYTLGKVMIFGLIAVLCWIIFGVLYKKYKKSIKGCD